MIEIPARFLSMMQVLLEDEYEDFHKIYEQPASTGIRTNTLKISPEELITRLPFKLEPLLWATSGFELNYQDGGERLAPGLLPEHAAGLYYIQEPSTMISAELLNPKPGDRVLDLCAAPGGKSTHLASLMRNEGLLIVNEIHPKRVWEAAQNLERWGARNAIITNDTPARLADQLPEYFDKILVDAPCSGEGMFRKSEAAKRDWSAELVASCAVRQGAILHSAAAMLKPGGLLAYTTCTFNPQENEWVIDSLLEKHPELEIVECKIPGVQHGNPVWLPQSRTRPELSSALRHWPHKSAGEGQFLALLRKLKPTESNRSQTKGDRPRIKAPETPGGNARKAINQFLRETLKDEILVQLTEERTLIQAGNYIYFQMPGAPALGDIKVIHPGWWLGTVQSSQTGSEPRFIPSHAQAMGMPVGATRRETRLSREDPRVSAYLHGEIFNFEGDDGWILVTLDGYALGWGKMSGGRVKNAYPRGLRRF